MSVTTVDHHHQVIKPDSRITTLLTGIATDCKPELIVELVKAVMVAHQEEVAESSGASKSVLFDNSDAPDLHPHLVYCVKRLVRGCGSGKDAARSAFAWALSACLAVFPVPPAVVLGWARSMITRETVGTGRKKEGDERAVMLGRVAAYTAIIESAGMNMDVGVARELVKELLQIRQRKSYFALPVDELLIRIFKAVGVEDRSLLLQEFQFPELLTCALTGSSILPPVTREALDVLPRLHPAWAVIVDKNAGGRELMQFCEASLLSQDRELHEFALLCLKRGVANIDALPATLAKWAQEKRKRGAIQELLDEIVDLFLQLLKDKPISKLPAALSSLPTSILAKKRHFVEGLFGTCMNWTEYMAACEEIKDSKERLEAVFLPLRIGKPTEEYTVEAVNLAVQLGITNNDVMSKLSWVLSSVHKDTLFPKILPAIYTAATSNDAGDDGAEPVRKMFSTAAKIIKKGDATFQLACRILVAVFAVSGEAECIELVDELHGFMRGDGGDNREEAFWTDLCLSLLSLKAAFCRRLAEELFKELLGSGKIGAAGIQQLCDIIKQQRPGDDMFEVDHDDVDNDSDDESDQEEEEPGLFSQQLYQQQDNDSDLDDEQMAQLDGHLAAAVAARVKAAGAAKREKRSITEEGAAIQNKCLGLLETVCRSKTVTPVLKASFLQFILAALKTLEESSSTAAEKCDRLVKCVKAVTDGLQSDDALVSTVIGMLAEGSRPKTVDAICITLIALGKHHQLQDPLRTALKHNLSSGGSLCVKVITCLLRHSQGKLVSELVTPADFDAAALKPFLMTSLLVAIRGSRDCHAVFGQWAVLSLCEGIKKAGASAKPAWIRSQLSEIHLWVKALMSVDLLPALQSLLSEDTLSKQPTCIDQLNKTIKLLIQ